MLWFYVIFLKMQKLSILFHGVSQLHSTPTPMRSVPMLATVQRPVFVCLSEFLNIQSVASGRYKADFMK